MRGWPLDPSTPPMTRPNEGHGGLSRKLVFAVSEKGMA